MAAASRDTSEVPAAGACGRGLGGVVHLAGVVTVVGDVSGVGVVAFVVVVLDRRRARAGEGVAVGSSMGRGFDGRGSADLRSSEAGVRSGEAGTGSGIGFSFGSRGVARNANAPAKNRGVGGGPG
jgi:hypothetical protein